MLWYAGPSYIDSGVFFFSRKSEGGPSMMLEYSSTLRFFFVLVLADFLHLQLFFWNIQSILLLANVRF